MGTIEYTINDQANMVSEKIYPRDCPKCGKGTNNYWLCDACVEKEVAKGRDIWYLYAIEEDTYICAGLSRMASHQ